MLGPVPSVPSPTPRPDSGSGSAGRGAFAPVTLVVGPEDLLADRAVAGVLAARRAVSPDTELRELAGAGVEAGALTQLASPSLFGEPVVIVLRDVQDLRPEVVAEVRAYLSAPAPDVSLVLVHGGGARQRQLLDAARAVGAVEVSCERVTRFADLVDFIRSEFRRAGRSLGEDASRALLDAVGRDLRDLAAACSQLIADTDGAVDAATVRRYYAGRAEVTSFAVADAAVEGRAAEALERLRWALGVGVAPVLVTSALAQGLRAIARLAGAPRGSRPADLARDLGMPPWKVDRVRTQLRGWTPDGLAEALRAVAVADAEVKGAGGDPAYALDRVVGQVARARNRAN